MSEDLNLKDFRRWYESYCKLYLEPAAQQFVSVLSDYLTDELQPKELVRLKVQSPRIKSVDRTWIKVTRTEYLTRISTYEDIPLVIDDLLGLRIICTNTSDEMKVIDLLSQLDVPGANSVESLVQVSGSQRDYISNPKKSGYRAWHINVLTSIPRGRSFVPVGCEIQVRTLLQEGWGELTHEDTYKPGGRVTPFARTLSQRMAELLETLDLMAEDLRQELDGLQESSLDDTESPAVPPASIDIPPDGTPAGNQQAEQAKELLAGIVADLAKPIDLASLAMRVQKEFGSGVSADWFAHGSFKSLLLSAVPDARLTSDPPSYVIPQHLTGELPKREAIEVSDLPELVVRLKNLDKNLPTIGSMGLQSIYEALSIASHEIHWTEPADLSSLNELVRLAREVGSGISRRPIDFVAKTLLFNDKLHPGMDTNYIRKVFADWLKGRASDLENVTPASVEAMLTWANGAQPE